MPKLDYSNLIQPKGLGFKASKIDKTSHYRDPIDHKPGRMAGNSRIAGDASPDAQIYAIDKIINASQQAGLSSRQTAHVLAIASVESGFNPDAANGINSAQGLGQLSDKVAEEHGITEENINDPSKQAEALVAYYQKNWQQARNENLGEEHIYKLHHDNNLLKNSTEMDALKISNEQIMPLLDKYEEFVKQHQQISAAKVNPNNQQIQPQLLQKISTHSQLLHTQIEQLCRDKVQKMGILWDDGMEKTVLALTYVAVQNKFNNVTHLALSEDNKTINIADIGEARSFYGDINTNLAAQTTKESSIEKIQQLEQQSPPQNHAVTQGQEQDQEQSTSQHHKPLAH